MDAASAGFAPFETSAKNAPVAQLDRALDYESRGQEFESLRARHFGIESPGRRCRPDAAIRPLEQGNPELLLQIPDSPAEIGLLESEQIRCFAETATAFRHLSVP